MRMLLLQVVLLPECCRHILQEIVVGVIGLREREGGREMVLFSATTVLSEVCD